MCNFAFWSRLLLLLSVGVRFTWLIAALSCICHQGQSSGSCFQHLGVRTIQSMSVSVWSLHLNSVRRHQTKSRKIVWQKPLWQLFILENWAQVTVRRSSVSETKPPSLLPNGSSVAKPGHLVLVTRPYSHQTQRREEPPTPTPRGFFSKGARFDVDLNTWAPMEPQFHCDHGGPVSTFDMVITGCRTKQQPR